MKIKKLIIITFFSFFLFSCEDTVLVSPIEGGNNIIVNTNNNIVKDEDTIMIFKIYEGAKWRILKEDPKMHENADTMNGIIVLKVVVNK